MSTFRVDHEDAYSLGKTGNWTGFHVDFGRDRMHARGQSYRITELRVRAICDDCAIRIDPQSDTEGHGVILRKI